MNEIETIPRGNASYLFTHLFICSFICLSTFILNALVVLDFLIPIRRLDPKARVLDNTAIDKEDCDKKNVHMIIRYVNTELQFE